MPVASTKNMRKPIVLTSATIVAVTVSVDSAELVELVRLSESQLRARFDVPATCEPALSATRRSPRSPIDVRIRCIDHQPGDASSASAPPRWPHPGR